MAEPTDFVPDMMEMEDEQGVYGPAGRPARALTHDEIKSIVAREIEDAVGGVGTDTSERRRQAIRYYYGQPLGNEVEGRSQVQMLDVLEVVEWSMPSLMRMFTGGDTVVRFRASNPQMQKQADLATAYVNHVFQNEMGGFQILYDWFKTALLEKNGIVKVRWAEKRCPKVRSYTGLTEEELMVLLQEDGAEPMEVVQRGEIPVPTFDATIRMWTVKHGVEIDGVAPENFLISRRAVRLDDDTHFTAERVKMRISDLVAMGFPFEEIADIPSDDTPEFDQGRYERFQDDGGEWTVTTADRMDVASREVWVTECYMHIDEDGDGYSELRKILIVGESVMTILEDEEVNQNPFCSITPVPMPHKFFGQSLADLVMDLQVIRSTIMRQILDNLYLANNPRMEVVEGQVEYDDLLTVRPGGLVRVLQPGMVNPIQLPPLPREAFEALQYLEQVRSNRTGIVAHGNEVDASAINSTATGLAQLMAEKQQKIELIARIFAQTGMKTLFRKMLREIVENDTKQHQIMHNGEWIQIDPAQWDDDFDLEIEVGLGAGAAIERIANLEKIMAVQAQHVMNGGMGYTVTPKNLWESAVRLAEAAGYKNKDLFFQNPENQPPPQPEPDPKLKEMELEGIKLQADQETKRMQLEIDRLKEENLAAYRYVELEQKERMERERMQIEAEVRREEQDARVQAATISAEATVEAAQIAARSRAKESSSDSES